MKTRLIDFRTSVGGFSESFTPFIRKICSDILFSYIGKIDARFELEDTNSLSIGIGNSDNTKSYFDGKIYYSIGHKERAYVGGVNCYFSETHLQTLSVIEMRLHILEVSHQMLVSFAQYFNEDDTLLWIAYEKMKTSDFFVQHTYLQTSRNKKYTVQIECRNDFDVNTYRLKIIFNETQEVKTIPVGVKSHFFSDKTKKPNDMNSLIYSMGIPQFFKEKGWKKDKYYFSWGDETYQESFNNYDFEVENYEYDAQNNELRRI